jgi:hypothetical protein
MGFLNNGKSLTYLLAMAYNYHKSKYTPVHPDKYAGDPTAIICRSSWERKFAHWCDHSPHVVKWLSEEIVIPYVCPTDNRIHRYFVDFKVQIKNKDGVVRTYLIEIKPEIQTRPPIPPKRQTQKYLKEVMTWGKNEAKWKAAENYAKDRGWQFMVFTEKHLGIK